MKKMSWLSQTSRVKGQATRQVEFNLSKYMTMRRKQFTDFR